MARARYMGATLTFDARPSPTMTPAITESRNLPSTATRCMKYNAAMVISPSTMSKVRKWLSWMWMTASAASAAANSPCRRPYSRAPRRYVKNTTPTSAKADTPRPMVFRSYTSPGTSACATLSIYRGKLPYANPPGCSGLSSGSNSEPTLLIEGRASGSTRKSIERSSGCGEYPYPSSQLIPYSRNTSATTRTAASAAATNTLRLSKDRRVPATLGSSAGG